MITGNGSQSKSVLFISYIFPPLGGSGVQRKLKYVKYLPESGWTPHVLTVKDISYYTYDQTLLREVPKEAHIIRTNSLDPLRLSAIFGRLKTKSKDSYNSKIHYPNNKTLHGRIYRFLRSWCVFPDNQLGWIPFAVQKGLHTIKSSNISVIFAGVHPSSGIIAYLLSRITGTPYILDFADAWLDNPHLIVPSKIHRKAHSYLERVVVGNASLITVYSKKLQERFVCRYPILKDRVAVLPNGFDLDDLGYIQAKERTSNLTRIVYMGSLYKHQEENFLSFLHALKIIPVEILNTLEILFIGNVYQEAISYVKNMNLENQVKFTGYLAHGDALSYLASANAGLIFIKPGDYSMVTGKVFEYLMIGIPILACIERQSECAEILHQVGQDKWIAAPDDINDIARVIESLSKAGWPLPEQSKLIQFDRKHNTRRLAQLLDQLTL